MRRPMPPSLAPALLAGLLLAGCGSEGPARTEAEPRSTSPLSTIAPSGGDLVGFPLDAGYPEHNDDDGSPVVVSDRPATRAFTLCGQQAWDPRADGTDVLGVQFRGEAEWATGRTLVLYPDADAAARALSDALGAVTACPEEREEYGTAVHTPVDPVAGDQSVAWMDRWRSPDLGGGYSTGLAVMHLVRVGRAVLLSYEAGEGNGSQRSLEAALGRAERADLPVLAAMGDLT